MLFRPKPFSKRADVEVSNALFSVQALKFIVKNNFRNTYTISKNLTERLVMSYGEKGLNVCIMRPSLVTSIAGNPYPGYIGNTSGITGTLLGAAYGERASFWPLTPCLP
jgi:nucleoside-diphosphate-sugar epimerase